MSRTVGSDKFDYTMQSFGASPDFQLKQEGLNSPQQVEEQQKGFNRKGPRDPTPISRMPV
jgi:hypothetical protein